MKPLAGEMYAEITDTFRGKVFAFVPVTPQGHIGLGIAVANEKGYCPVPLSSCHADTYGDMYKHAMELNSRLGFDVEAAARIIASTMN